MRQYIFPSNWKKAGKQLEYSSANILKAIYEHKLGSSAGTSTLAIDPMHFGSSVKSFVLKI